MKEQIAKKVADKAAATKLAEEKAAAEKAKAEFAQAIADKKAEEARLLKEANDAKLLAQETARKVTEASAKEQKAKDLAEAAKIAAVAAKEKDENSAATKQLLEDAKNLEDEAHRSSLITRECIDESINVSEVNANASKIMADTLKAIDNAPWTVERVFALFDQDGDGNLDTEEITTAITAISERFPTSEQIAALFKKYDINGDGQFDKGELKAMLKDDALKKKRRKSAAGRKQVLTKDLEDKAAIQTLKEELVAKEILINIEKDAAEAISISQKANDELKKKEVEALTAKLEQDETGKELARQERVINDIKEGKWSTERVFQAFDADNSGTLDVGELKLALTSLLDKEVSNSDAKKFAKKFDTDGDGTISIDEFEACVASAQASLNNFFTSLFSGDDNGGAVARKEIEKLEGA
ncbi:hypothetical protein TL16_g03872 [Triparma laevis f. inornata]|uniref:EF-hand domain-containing protein n=1 Tax=Triparma laevis f. inornata TaxID=1714386 RepID=A0A9W7E3M3_9STRA|nr:hypothetical protein TL16_g03872 [Triparma laevis f. inornata]